MRKLRKAGIFAALMLCLALVPAMTANAGFRKQENGKYRYYTSKNHYVKNNFKNIKTRTNGKKKTYTYYFDENGYMQTGWQLIRSQMYYFDRNGRMLKNSTKNGHYLQKNGQMLRNGWHNNVYYGPDGAAIPGYRQDVKNGFKKNKKGMRYLQADGTYAQKKWLCIRDSAGQYYWYYFYSTGYMAKNTWIGSRHVDKNGRMDKLKKQTL